MGNRPMAVDISVSIINTDNRDLLRECLRSIFEGTQHASLEVFVVDNASRDGSAEMVSQEFPGVRLIRNERRLRFCANHNRVLRMAGGRHILILNEDTIIPPGTFDRVVAFMDAEKDAGAVGLTIRNPDGSLQYSYARFPSLLSTTLLALSANRWFQDGHYPFHRLPPDGHPREVDWTNGACLAVRREAFEEVGLLDEGLLIYGEETDWCYRLRKAGWKVYYLPDVSIYHYQGKSTSQERPRRRFRINRSAIYFFRKHYRWPNILALRAMLFATSLARLLLWAPIGVWRRHRRRARLEMIYNWRTIMISLLRDDMFDHELVEIG